MKYALLSGSRVLQVADAGPGGGEPFAVNEAFRWVPCGDDVTDWHIYEDNKFTLPPPPVPEPMDPRAKLAAFLAANPDVLDMLQ